MASVPEAELAYEQRIAGNPPPNTAQSGIGIHGSDKMEVKAREASFNEDKEAANSEDTAGRGQLTASKGPATYQPADDRERALDKRINLKLDLTVLPVLSMNYFLAGLDKNNIGNALTVGFIEDTGFSPDTVNNAVSMTAVWVVLAPFLIALGRRVGPRNFISVLVFGWSICTITTAYAPSEGIFYMLRLFQALFEVPLVQLSLYIVSTLYPQRFYGKRLAIYVGFSNFAGAFGGAIAYGVFKLPDTGLHPWQKLFIIEGSISMFFGVLVMILLPQSLGKFWIFTAEEKEHAVARITRDSVAYSTSKADTKDVTWRDWKDACKDWQKIVLLIATVCTVMPVVSFLVFAPIVIGGMGYSGLKANLMTVTPYLTGAFGIYVFQYSSDRFKERSLHLIAAGLLCLIGLAVMIGSNSNPVRYGFLHVCLGGAFAPGVLIAAWLADNTPEAATRAVMFGLLALTPVSSVIAGQIFKPKYAPTFKFPLKVSLGFTVAAMVLYAFVRVLYMLENAKRRKLIDAMTPEEIEAERVNPARRGDRKITFIRQL